MSRLIKKYKNRRLYDTETSQYITIEQLQHYVVSGVMFKIEDSETGKDITNSILLQIIVEMEAGPTQFLSSDVLRQIISFANHPMHLSLKMMIGQLFASLEQPADNRAYQKAAEAWGDQINHMVLQWQKIFKE